MTDAEIVAYLAGAYLAQQGGGLGRFLLDHGLTPAFALTDTQAEAMKRLGRERWAYWVGRGWSENRPAGRP